MCAANELLLFSQILFLALGCGKEIAWDQFAHQALSGFGQIATADFIYTSFLAKRSF
jgi:hypothetical protein